MYNFNTRGIGIISNKFIVKNTFVGICCVKDNQFSTVGRYVFDGWFEAPPLGRYLNHNLDSNLYFIKKNSIIELYSKNNIEKYCELTIDYIEYTKLLNIPDNLIKLFGIQNFDYIHEVIEIKNKLI